MTDTSIRYANNDAFTLRPFLFLLSLSGLWSILWVFLRGGFIELLEGFLVLVFFAFLLIATLSAAFRRRWRRLISIVLGAVPAIGVCYVAAFLAYALAPSIFHYKLTGPDWERIPKGYFGVLPEKAVAELNVPKQYLDRINGPTSQPQSAISIAILYPSMNSAVGAESSENAIGIIITASREDDSRKGVKQLIHEDGRTRDAQSDVGPLCALVDHQHPGYAGDEFYSSCNEDDQTFFINCFPPTKGQRLCVEVAHVGNQLGVEMFYKDSMLKDHSAMLEAIKRVVISFLPNGH